MYKQGLQARSSGNVQDFQTQIKQQQIKINEMTREVSELKTNQDSLKEKNRTLEEYLEDWTAQHEELETKYNS